MSAPFSGRPALFMDRDGCLIENRVYPTAAWYTCGGRLRRFPRLTAGIAAVMATNRPALASLPAEVAVSQTVRRLGLGARPSCHPSADSQSTAWDCECRKPKPGLLIRAAAELGLDLSRSIMIGDKPSDVEAGQAAGAATVLVLTGYGRGEWEYRRQEWTVKPDHVAEDLFDAVEWAMAKIGAGKYARPAARLPE